MMRGHRAVFETMEPFSVETGSAGSVSWFHDAISCAVASTEMGFSTRDMGGGIYPSGSSMPVFDGYRHETLSCGHIDGVEAATTSR